MQLQRRRSTTQRGPERAVDGACDEAVSSYFEERRLWAERFADGMADG